MKHSFGCTSSIIILMNTPIKKLTRKEIADHFKEDGLPKFRSKQAIEWIYKRGASSYDEMSNISKELRAKLAEEYPLYQPTVTDRQVSKDGTRKYLLGFEGGYSAETVGIPSSDGRLTVCCSSQAGCAMACDFCATGKGGFKSNLEIGEIVDQVLTVQNDFGERVTNIVVMGQGEPLLNLPNVIEALRICNDKSLLGIGARKITISTCGIVPGIEKLSEIEEQFTLAVSLHSAIQETRNSIMPGVKKYSLADLKKALSQYIQRTNRRITFEYALMKNVNDSPEHLDSLIRYCDGLLCHVNLIPLNEVPESPYHPVTDSTMLHWEKTLLSNGIETSIRNSRGGDIAGACGQLANTHK